MLHISVKPFRFHCKFFLISQQYIATVKQNKRFNSTCISFNGIREFVNSVMSPVGIVPVPGPGTVSPVIRVLPYMPLTVSVCPVASRGRMTGCAVSAIQAQVLLKFLL